MMQRYRNSVRNATVQPKASSKSPRRRLVDYTQCRRDGTTSNKANGSKTATEYPRKTLMMGLPTCHALEASLADMIVTNDDKHQDAKLQEESRIEFYLKVAPKSQRKPSRISTLDRANSRNDLMQQAFASSRSLEGRSTATTSGASSMRYHQERQLQKRSASTPVPSTIETFRRFTQPLLSSTRSC